MPFQTRKRRRSPSEDPMFSLLRRMDKRLKALEGKDRRIQVTSSEEDFTNSDYEKDEEGHNYSSHSSEVEFNTNITGAVHNGDGEAPSTSLGKSESHKEPHPLDKGLLAVLGDEVSNKTVVGQPLQPEIAERWMHIAKNGLEEPVLNQLMEKYPLPENGTSLGPPKLNLIVKQAIHESVERRDDKLANIQSRLAASLSAMGQVMTKVLEKKGEGEEEEEKVKYYIETLNDAGRLLIDVIHSESVSRRELVTYDLNKYWKGTLSESPLDNWLFGEDSEGRLKAAKELKVSSSQLKNVRSMPGKNTGDPSKFKSGPRLNFRSLPQRQQGAKQGRRKLQEAPQSRQRQGKTRDQNHYLAKKSQPQDRVYKRYQRH